MSKPSSKWTHAEDDVLRRLYPAAPWGEILAAPIVPACRSCNSRKGAKTPLEFMMHQHRTRLINQAVSSGV